MGAIQLQSGGRYVCPEARCGNGGAKKGAPGRSWYLWQFPDFPLQCSEPTPESGATWSWSTVTFCRVHLCVCPGGSL